MATRPLIVQNFVRLLGARRQTSRQAGRVESTREAGLVTVLTGLGLVLVWYILVIMFPGAAVRCVNSSTGSGIDRYILVPGFAALYVNIFTGSRIYRIGCHAYGMLLHANRTCFVSLFCTIVKSNVNVQLQFFNRPGVAGAVPQSPL